MPALAAAVTVIAAAGACGSSGTAAGSSGAGGPGSSGASQPANGGGGKAVAASPTALKKYDPPTKFGSAGAALPPEANIGTTTFGGYIAAGLPVTLSGSVAYVAASDSVQAVDLTSGAQLWRVVPTDKPVSADGQRHVPGPFVVAGTNGGSTVYCAFAVTVAGKGTTPSQLAMELQAIDPATGKALWSATVPQQDQSKQYATEAASVVGVDADAVVVAETDEFGSATYAISPTTHQQLWAKDKFVPDVLLDGTVVGVSRPDSVTGLVTAFDAATGTQRWAWSDRKYTAAHFTQAGPDMVAFSGKDYDSLKPVSEFSDPKTGKTLATANLVGDCVYDQQATAICAANDGAVGQQLQAFDATNGHPLWQLPDSGSNRIAPRVTAVWHGAVYGTTSNGAVILDAHTGADKQDSPGLAPSVVDEYFGRGVVVRELLLGSRPTSAPRRALTFPFDNPFHNCFAKGFTKPSRLRNVVPAPGGAARSAAR
jgi:outer membrane protein assembly factor BamB